MTVIDITRDDFDSLRQESRKVNTELQKMAGWKGRAVDFSFDAPGAYFMKVEQSAITIIGEGGPVGRMDWSEGKMAVTGELFVSCRDAQQVARVLRSTCLSDANVQSLRRNTCGCSEVIPIIVRPGLHGESDAHAIVFFPQERFDIRQALLNARISFTERPLEDYDRYCRENLERFRDTGFEPDMKNDFGRISVLFDGKKFVRMDRARHLSGELERGQRNSSINVMRQIEVCARTTRYTLQEDCFGSNEKVQWPAIVYKTAEYPLIGEGSVFLMKDGEPQWGCYLNAEGRITVCDGRGWSEYPRQASHSDHELERLLNSADAAERLEGVSQVRSFLQDRCLSEENRLKAGQDIDQWCDSLEEDKEKKVSSRIKR